MKTLICNIKSNNDLNNFFFNKHDAKGPDKMHKWLGVLLAADAFDD